MILSLTRQIQRLTVRQRVVIFITREAFGKAGIAPRQRPISLRGKLTLDGLEGSATLNVQGGSRMARFRRRVRRLAKSVWHVLYGEEGSD